MWRWPTVAAKKDKNAKAKAKINTMHAKLISVAAEKGADPNQNNALADAIHSARKEWVTADVIERAILRGSGADKEAKKVEEIFYEGYGPGGTAIIVRTLTDNRNRTAPSIRHIFSAFWGNLGETGSVSGFLFDYFGKIVINSPKERDNFELLLLETNAIDYEINDEITTIWTPSTELASVKSSIIEGWYEIVESGFFYKAKNYTPITEFDHALKLYKMFDEFNDDEDVEMTFNNADIDDNLWKEVEEFVESKKFRT